MSLNTGANVNVELMLDANNKYMYQSPDTKILVKNVAELVLYRKEPAQSKSLDSMTFSLDTDGFFIDRNAFITIDRLPIKFTFPSTAAAANAIDFHEKVFNNYQDLTLKPFALLNAINSIEVGIDSLKQTVTNVSEILPIISNYYKPEDVHQFFDASQMDYTWSNNIHKGAINYVPSISTTGNQIKVRNAPATLDNNNPYSAVANNSFNSRTPLLTADDDAAFASGATTGTFWLHNLTTWLPFNLLGIAGDDTPLYNVNKITIKISFHPNWASRLFSTTYDPVTKTSPYTMSIDNSKINESFNDSTLALRLYRPPQNIQSNLKPENPYIIEYPIIDLDSRFTDVNFRAGEVSKSVNSTNFDMRAIPKQVFVALVPKRVDDNDYLTNNNHFCRIDSLACEMAGTNTIIAPNNSSEMIYQYCKQEGLNKSKNTALYLSGFPAIIDVSNMIGCKTNSFVGVSTDGTSGKNTLRLNMNITRLHQDTTNFMSTAAADLWKKLDKTYELKCVFIYQGFLCYNLLGQKFASIESLSSSNLNSIVNNINELYHKFVPEANILGGSIFSAIGPALKNVGKGLFNVVKAAIANKDGFRDNLMKAYNGAGLTNGMYSNVIGGLDNHMPLNGGREGNSWKSY